MDIEKLGLGMRTLKALRSGNIKTLEQLSWQTASGLCRLDRFGTTSLREIELTLAHHGMVLGTIPPPKPAELEPSPKGVQYPPGQSADIETQRTRLECLRIAMHLCRGSSTYQEVINRAEEVLSWASAPLENRL